VSAMPISTQNAARSSLLRLDLLSTTMWPIQRLRRHRLWRAPYSSTAAPRRPKRTPGP
jgi:hypothetical protein